MAERVALDGAHVDDRDVEVGDRGRVGQRPEPRLTAADERRDPQRPVMARDEDEPRDVHVGERRELAAEQVDVDVGRQQRHGVELLEELRRPGQRHLPQRLQRHLRAHRVRGDHDPVGVRARQQPQQPFEPVAGEEGAVAVVEIEPRVRRRRPGVADADRRGAEVVHHLRVAVDALGEVGVEPVDEDHDPPLVRRLPGERGVDRGEEGGLVADAGGVERHEVGLRVGRQAVGKGQRPGLRARAEPRCRTGRSRACATDPGRRPRRRRPRAKSRPGSAPPPRRRRRNGRW